MTLCQWVIPILEDFDLYQRNCENLKPGKIKKRFAVGENSEGSAIETTAPGDKEFSSARDFTSKLSLSGCDVV